MAVRPLACYDRALYRTVSLAPRSSKRGQPCGARRIETRSRRSDLRCLCLGDMVDRQTMGACSINFRWTRGRGHLGLYCSLQYRHGAIIRLSHSRGDFDSEFLVVRGIGDPLGVPVSIHAWLVGDDITSMILAAADNLKHECHHKGKLWLARV